MLDDAERRLYEDLNTLRLNLLQDYYDALAAIPNSESEMRLEFCNSSQEKILQVCFQVLGFRPGKLLANVIDRRSDGLGKPDHCAGLMTISPHTCSNGGGVWSGPLSQFASYKVNIMEAVWVPHANLGQKQRSSEDQFNTPKDWATNEEWGIFGTLSNGLWPVD